MGPIGMQEMMFIIVLALLLFGPKKLPELARLLGKGLSEFRRAKNELKNTFDTHLQELERETRMEEARKRPVSTISSSPSPYSYVADEYGRNSNDYGYNGSQSSWPSEPAVESHAANGIAAAPETPSLPPASAVPGTVPRGASEHQPASVNGAGTDEHPA